MPKVAMQDYEENVYVLSRSYLSMKSREEGGWREGHFNHPEGLVRVFESATPRQRVTAMFFVHQGYSHSRRWETIWGDKTLARLARELVEEVVYG
jgi:hypothetical protein